MKKALEKGFAVKIDKENDKHEEQLDLMNDLLDNRSPISPYGYFEMTGGSFLSALATIATYLIVLVQFKTSEK